MAAASSMTSLKEHDSRAIQPQIDHTEGERLSQLLSRLGDDVMQLVNSQLTLLKVELREEARTFTVGAALIGVGAAISLIGFALVNVAVAFGVSTLFAASNLSEAAQFALGFVITGIFYLLVGAIVVLAMRNRLARLDVVPDRFVEELRKDKQWLKNEL